MDLLIYYLSSIFHESISQQECDDRTKLTNDKMKNAISLASLRSENDQTTGFAKELLFPITNLVFKQILFTTRRGGSMIAVIMTKSHHRLDQSQTNLSEGTTVHFSNMKWPGSRLQRNGYVVSSHPRRLLFHL